VSDRAKNGLCKRTVGGRSAEPRSLGIKRTAGSHPKERGSGGLPRTMAHIRNSLCPPTEILCRAFGLFCGIPCAGNKADRREPFLHRVYRRKGLGRSRLFGIGEPVSCQPNRAGKIKSELLHLAGRRRNVHCHTIAVTLDRCWHRLTGC
jgi:hypothetical protein